MSFPSIRLEGSLLSAELLGQLDRSETAGQRPSDFGLPTGKAVKDEIALAWADAQDQWRIFRRKLDALPVDATATSETRHLWMVPLLRLLGWQLESTERGEVLPNAKNYRFSHRAADRAGFVVHLLGWRDSLDLKRDTHEGVAGPRMSPHALVQEYLNLTEHVYALVSNGRQLRLLRDSVRFVRQSFVEFDLERIFSDGLYTDFSALFRLLHASRMPRTPQETPESLIERYHQDSLDAGARIRAGLSGAVKESLLQLANGFLTHRGNDALRAALKNGQVTPAKFHQSLLRLIYRLLFLLVIEERDLVFPTGSDRRLRERYARGYSLARLRRLAEKRHYADRHFEDAWLAVLSTFRLFEDAASASKLGLAPLGGDLFAPDALGPLHGCRLDNESFLNSLRRLSVFQHPEKKHLIRVNYASLNVEEFGSVYQGLLEFEPTVVELDGRWTYSLPPGEERSKTGSHYTPEELVQPLLKHSLEHLIAEALKKGASAVEKEKAILSLRICDVACGSGHILLAAARRLATELAIVRTREEQPSPTALRSAVRDVIRHCLYGMDLNPLAVELCKVALWLEAHVPGQALSFLDHRIHCGNAIVGLAHRDELKRGIPDEAFKTLPGDDKDLAAALRRQNKDERKGQQALNFAGRVEADLRALDEDYRAFEQIPERGAATDYQARRLRYEQFRRNPRLRDLSLLADAQVAQFYLPKTPENRGKHVTHDAFSRWMEGVNPVGPGIAAAMAIAERKRFGHWFIEFWDVVDAGGFDLIIGNPPYLGGQALSGTYGHAFCEWVKWEYAPTGVSDLVVYFLRRIYDLLRPGGFVTLITTNSIKDGDVRVDGLEQVMRQGGSLTFAVSGTKWPGVANLHVSLFSLHKGQWANRPRVLDGREVPFISALFEGYADAGSPLPLKENQDRIFQGSVFLGDGFLLTASEAEDMVARDAKLREVILPVINGQELNSHPDQQSPRRIINFFDWPLQQAAEYGEAFERIRLLVKPVRDRITRAVRREKWWHYAERASGLYARLASLRSCIVIAQTSKHHAFSASPTNRVFLQTCYVFASDRWWEFAAVQSTLHQAWVVKYSGSLETRQRYLPTQCFVTFPLPRDPASEVALAAIGESYHEHRRELMRDLWLGLTDLYNLFHRPDLAPEHIAKVATESRIPADEGFSRLQRLRALHVQLDQTVLAAYGWDRPGEFGPALELRHDFYPLDFLPENDRTRLTLHPESRREVLARLLKLNHQRAAAAEQIEKQAALVAPVTIKKPKPAKLGTAENRTHSRGINFKRGAIAAYAVNRLCDRWEFGRTQMEKVLYLTQHGLGVDLEFEFKREAAGPFDEEIHKLESLARKQSWFETRARSGALGVTYTRGSKLTERCDAAAVILGSQKERFDWVLEQVGKMDTEQAELWATVHAAWNDLILADRPTTEQHIVQEVYAWHPSKARFTEERIQKCVAWMKQNDFVPQGVRFQKVVQTPTKEMELGLDLFGRPAVAATAERALPTGARDTLGGLGYAIQLVRELLSQSGGALAWPRLVDAFTLATQPLLMGQQTKSEDVARVKAWSKRWNEVLPPGSLVTAIEQLGTNNLAASKVGGVWTIRLKDGPKATASQHANYDAWLALRALGPTPAVANVRPTLVVAEFDDFTQRMEALLVA